MTVRSNVAIKAATAAIAETAWVDIAYTDNAGAAQVAECPYNGLRLIVRRARLAESEQPALFPTWRHHSFLTDLAADTVAVDRFHRHHAVVELAIRDLKENAGLGHVPSGHFAANGAWLACAVLAHNLIRWTATLGHLVPDDQTYTVGPPGSATSPCPPGSSTAPAPSPSGPRPAGHGPPSSPSRSNISGPSSPPPADHQPDGPGAPSAPHPAADNTPITTMNPWPTTPQNQPSANHPLAKPATRQHPLAQPETVDSGLAMAREVQRFGLQPADCQRLKPSGSRKKEP